MPGDAGERIEQLVAAARAARQNAYAPYSAFAVGAAVLAGDAVFVGANVENAALPLSMCAERGAVGAAVAAGHHRLQAVAIVTDAAEPTPPCGGCRQVLWEIGPEMLVVAETIGGARTAWALEDLLPGAFDRGSPS